MKNTKVLIIEGPWSDRVDDNTSTTSFYSAAEQILSDGVRPIHVAKRPLIPSLYLRDIESFLDLPCNESGPNVIIMSAHGYIVRRKSSDRKGFRRAMSAFDGRINITKELPQLKEKLNRSVVVLDACNIGIKPLSLLDRCGAIAVIGFGKKVVWTDSSMFVLALLLKLQEARVFELRQVRELTSVRRPRIERVINGMVEGVYSSLSVSLNVETAYRKKD